jgi:hypothetical protein
VRAEHFALALESDSPTWEIQAAARHLDPDSVAAMIVGLGKVCPLVIGVSIPTRN